MLCEDTDAVKMFLELVNHYRFQQGPNPESRGLTNFTFWAGAGFSKSWDPKAPIGSELFQLDTRTIRGIVGTLAVSRMFDLDSLEGISPSQLRQIVYQLDMVESRTGAPTIGSGGGSVAFASGLSPAPLVTFPVPAHRTVRADFPHTALGRDHAFAHGRLAVRGARRVRPMSSHSLLSGKRTKIPDLTLCLRHNHWRSRRVVCWSMAR